MTEKKYTAYGAMGEPPSFCKHCGSELVEGKVSPQGFDEYTGEQIFLVQIHCPKVSFGELERSGRGGNDPETTHTVIYGKRKLLQKEA